MGACRWPLWSNGKCRKRCSLAPRTIPTISTALASVIGLHSIVPPDAFTAETPGLERAGNGVLIDENGRRAYLMGI